VLNYDQLAEVQRHVEPTLFAPGETIVRQGDPAEHFYIVTAGRAEVFVNQPDGRSILVDRLREGHYFGEMALLGGRARRATVRAAADEPVAVAALDAEMFGRLVESSPRLREELGHIVSLREVQSQVEALRSVDRDAWRALAADAPTRVFAPGETIVRQGALGETFFFILEGEAEVGVLRPGGREELIDRLVAGQYFGELALLGDQRRTATVRAAGTGPIRLLELGPDAFARLKALSADFAADLDRTAGERRSRV
jgi:CRP-like cAMP-binding protein